MSGSNEVCRVACVQRMTFHKLPSSRISFKYIQASVLQQNVLTTTIYSRITSEGTGKNTFKAILLLHKKMRSIIILTMKKVGIMLMIKITRNSIRLEFFMRLLELDSPLPFPNKPSVFTLVNSKLPDSLINNALYFDRQSIWVLLY